MRNHCNMVLVVVAISALALSDVQAQADRGSDSTRRPGAGMMQGGGTPLKKRGMELFHKAVEIYKRAGTAKEIDEAEGKFEEALEIFKKIRFDLGIGLAVEHLAFIHQSKGSFDKAVAGHEQALTIARRNQHCRLEGAALNNLATIRRFRGENSKAEELCAKALDVATRCNDINRKARVLKDWGQVYRFQGHFDKALEYYRRALDTIAGTDNDLVQAQVLEELGSVYGHMGQYTEGVRNLESALALAKKIGNVRVEQQALAHLGDLYLAWGKYQKAGEYYRGALETAKRFGESGVRGEALCRLGNVHSARGQYREAIEYYEKAVALAKETGVPRLESVALTRMGVVYWNWGRYSEAIDLYERALAIATQLGDIQEQSGILANMGRIYGLRGQYSRAVDMFDKALHFKQQAHDRKGEAKVLGGLGAMLAERERNEEALECVTKSLAIVREIGVPTQRLLELIGTVYLNMGETEKAEPYVQESGSALAMGRLYLVKSDYDHARDMYTKALSDAERTGRVNDLFTARVALGLIAEATGDLPAAQDHFARGAELTEEIRYGLSPSERAEFYSVRIGGFLRTAPYEGLARVFVKMNRPLDAFKESEFTKARVFAETLAERGERSVADLPREVLQNDADLNNGLSALVKNRKEALDKGDAASAATIEPEIKAIKEQLHAHVIMLRNRYPRFAATRYPQPMDLTQAALKGNEWVLGYDVTDSGTVIYLTRGKTLVKAVYKPVPRKVVDELVRKFREPLEINPGQDRVMEKLEAFDFASGKKLSDLLLGDILSDLAAGEPVMVIPDDCLGVLPFEMLVLNPGGEITHVDGLPCVSGAEFFGDRNPVAYCQSITALTIARTLEQRKRQDNKLLVIADPVFQAEDERAGTPSQEATPVPSAEAKLYVDLMAAIKDGRAGKLRLSRLVLTGGLSDALAAVFPGKADTYTGMAASKEQFLKTVGQGLNRYDKIVFATHGYFGSDLPGIMEPVLFLSLVPPGTDGFLRMSEVMGLEAGTDIVVLTACQSGLGQRISGEGTMGMGRAFQYAGARAVLMSLWSVAESASIKLIHSFFIHLSEGKSKLTALKLARDRIRSEGFEHPFFWAGFILVGETD